jgi:hypothetical protein
MQRTDKLSQSSNATHQMVGEEAILINITNGNYYSLNDTGAKFWSLLDGQRTIADCARLIALEYEVEPSLVEADLLELASEFQQEGLIIA